MLSEMAKRSIFIVLVISVIAVATVSCRMGGIHDSAKPGTTFGKIYVDTPEVYSRERLVNDRFEQDAWLRRKLSEEPKQGVQASSTVSRQSSGSLVISAGRDSKPAAAADGAKGNADMPTELKQSEDTPIEQFHDALTYREEVRNELLENQLDDRHDIAGNTLYRLKFDVSVIPENDTSAYAIVEATISGPSLSSSRRAEEFQPELLSEVFSDYFGDWDDEGIEYIKSVLVPVEELEEKTYSMLREVYEEWVEIQIEEFESGIKRAIENRLAKEAREMLTMIRYGALQAYFDFSDEDMGELIDVSDEELLEEIENIHRNLSVDAQSMLKKKPLTPGGNDCDHENDQGCTGYKERLSASGFERVWFEFTSVTSYYKGDVLYEINENFPTLDLGFANFAYDLLGLSGKSVYTYAVTPKERVQRIAGETRALQNLGLGLEGAAGVVDGRLSYSERAAAQANAVMRQPLLVGYSDSPDDPETAVMGWLIGPRFKLPSSAGEAVSFRHVPIQHSLTSIVSVPYWWKELKLVTKTYWLDGRGDRYSQSGAPLDDDAYKTLVGEQTTVKLPYDTQGIENLLLGRRQGPQVISTVNEDRVLMACTRGSVIIRGRELWRSTTVTLGAQRADEIMVLPNMNGIIATFNVVQPPPGLETLKPLKLVVWTSGGEADAGQVTVVRAHGAVGPQEGC